MRQDTSTLGSGSIGNSQAQNAVVLSLPNLVAARYRLTGIARHSLADGLKIVGIPSGTIIIPGGAGDTVTLPEMIFDLTAVTTLQVQLNVATGASDTASVLICLEKINH